MTKRNEGNTDQSISDREEEATKVNMTQKCVKEQNSTLVFLKRAQPFSVLQSLKKMALGRHEF